MYMTTEDILITINAITKLYAKKTTTNNSLYTPILTHSPTSTCISTLLYPLTVKPWLNYLI